MNGTSRRIVVFVIIIIALVGLAIILMSLGNENRPVEEGPPEEGVPDINAPGTGNLTISVINLDSFDRNVSINWYAKQWIVQFIAAGDTWRESYQVNWSGPAPVVGVTVLSEGWSDRKVVQMIEGSIVGVSFELPLSM